MRRLLMVLLFLAGGVTISHADSESDGAAAEKAGKYREALNHYVKALQAASEGGEKDQQLRERILLIAQKIKPSMAIPDEALRFEGRAEAAVQEAKDTQDYLNAAKEYEAALKIAPWNANYYFNLGVVLDKAGKYPEAIRNLKLYQLGAPNSPDSKEVAKRIAGLEYKMEQTSPQAQAAREQQGFDTLVKTLDGAKFRGERFSAGTGYYEVWVKDGIAYIGNFVTDPETRMDMDRNNPQRPADYFYRLYHIRLTGFETLYEIKCAADSSGTTIVSGTARLVLSEDGRKFTDKGCGSGLDVYDRYK